MKKKIKYYNLPLIDRAMCHFEEISDSIFISLISGIILFSFLFSLTTIFQMHYLFSLFLSYIVMISVSFILNKKYIFNMFNPKRLHEQYYQFFIVSISGFLINAIFLNLLVEILEINYLISQSVIVIIGFPALFTFYKNWVFSYK